jgi:hypothetical protein
MTIRNRIKEHRRIRAGDLVPHESNFRRHPERQRAALSALYEEIGFARSLLAYELPDGRLKLLDGHLRRELTPDMMVDVEVLDLTDDEARALLLSMDPLAALAETDLAAHSKLREQTPAASEALKALWQYTEELGRRTQARPQPEPLRDAPFREQYLVLVECNDEEHQTSLLEKFEAEGLRCRALLA